MEPSTEYTEPITEPIYEPEVPAVPDVDSLAQSADVASRIREARQRAMGVHTLDLRVPGYPDDCAVIVRFHPLDGGQVEKIAEQAQKDRSGRRGLRAAIKILAAACESIHVEQAGVLRPFAKVFGLPGDHPTRFGDERLEQGLDFEAGCDPEAAVRETFCRNDMAILAANDRLSRWFIDVTREVDSDLVGG